MNKFNEIYDNIADQVEGFGDQVTGFGEDLKTKVEIELTRIYGGKCTLCSPRAKNDGPALWTLWATPIETVVNQRPLSCFKTFQDEKIYFSCAFTV